MSGKSRTDGSVTTDQTERPFGLPRPLAAVLPLVLLALVVGAFVATTPFAALDTGGAPLPDVTITHATLPNHETIVLHVTNNGPTPVTISQVLVNEAYWNFHVEGSNDATLAPLESARVVVPYHWEPGWDLGISLVLSDGATFDHTIVAPQITPGLTGDLLWTLAVVGLFVGVIPVALGMLWYPFIRSMSDRWFHAVLAFSAGILAFLAFDAGFEAFELAGQIPGAFEGTALVVFGILGALFVVQSFSSWRSTRAADGDERASSGLWVAYLVALGIGLHNLAEGLAIGSSFALGRVALGAFLVIGFMIHNVTEGPAVVGPLAKDERTRPAWWHFAALGVLAGAPVILGGWIGGFAYSPTLGAFFLAIGVGAIAQVIWELTKIVRRDAASGRAATPSNLVAVLVGFVVMYVTDLFVLL